MRSQQRRGRREVGALEGPEPESRVDRDLRERERRGDDAPGVRVVLAREGGDERVEGASVTERTERLRGPGARGRRLVSERLSKRRERLGIARDPTPLELPLSTQEREGLVAKRRREPSGVAQRDRELASRRARPALTEQGDDTWLAELGQRGRRLVGPRPLA